MPKAILLLCVFWLSGCEITKSLSIEPKNYSKSDAKELLTRAVEDGRRSFDQMETFRIQAMGFSMSLIVTMFGYTFTRKIPGHSKSLLMLCIAGFCLMMYGLDTHEHDLSTRQVNRIVECKTALLQLDTLYESEQAKLDTILVRSMGVEKSDRSAKFALLFSWRIVQIAWYIGPFLLALLFAVFYEFYTNKKHPLINRWLTVEEEPPVSPHS